MNSDQETRNRAVAKGSVGSEASEATKEKVGEKPDETRSLSSSEI